MNISQAVNFAKDKHSGQMRKFEGKPYFVHPKRVSEIIYKFKESHKIDELMQAALLHDVLEDTNTEEKEIEEKFGKLVLSLVKELSSDEKEIKIKGKKEYLAEKMQHMSGWGLVIKLADRFDNVKDLKKASENFSKKYKEETKYIIDYLEKNRKLSATQKKLVKEIREKIK